MRKVKKEAINQEKIFIVHISWASLVAQAVKNPLVTQQTWVRSLGWEDPLEKRMATHSSILAWRIPWTEEPGGLQSTGSCKSQTRLRDKTPTAWVKSG